ncbi:MAG: outer membrane protein assembly factor BamE [Halioglobus sp.]
MRILLISLAITCLSACSFVGFPGVYKINVEQGNIVTQEMADQLKPGMSRRQVRFIMGTPLIEDTFNQDRWDYPYVQRNGNTVLNEASMTITFEGDSLVNVTGDILPPAWSDLNTTAPQNDSAPENGGDEAQTSDQQAPAAQQPDAEDPAS